MAPAAVVSVISGGPSSLGSQVPDEISLRSAAWADEGRDNLFPGAVPESKCHVSWDEEKGHRPQTPQSNPMIRVPSVSRITSAGSFAHLDPEAKFSLLVQLRHLITIDRIVMIVASVIFIALGVGLVSEDSWAIKVTLPSVMDEESCIALCERSRTDDKFAGHLGGRGLCRDSETDESLVSFKHCTISSKLKASDCTSLSDVDGTEDSTRCRFQVAPAVWKPYVTISLFTIAMVFCFQQAPPEVLLMGTASLLCALGVITRKDLFAGLSNSGVLGLAVLGPISEAITESGIMEQAVGLMLGNPSTLGVAIPRMMLPVALLSAFLSNTATVAILIPIVVSWSRRLEVHPGKLLMPLSFAAQLGGSCTLLGSSHCLVAKAAISSAGSEYDMAFFDLAPIGVILTVFGMGVIWVMVMCTNLLRSSADDSQMSPADDILYVYDFSVVVSRGGAIVGKNIEELGLARLPGVLTVTCQARGNHDKLQSGDVLIAECNDKGVSQLRNVPGIDPVNQKDLGALGRGRHHRFLYEVVVRGDSVFVSSGMPSAEEMLSTYEACLVAGPKRSVKNPPAQKSLCSSKGPIEEGSVLLLEADKSTVAYTKERAWSEAFAIVHHVPMSSPPRHGLPVDKVRAYSTFIGFVILIILTTLKVVKLDYGGGLLVLFYLLTTQLTLKQVMGSFKPSILLTIVGALAMGMALSRSGVIDFVSGRLVALAAPAGFAGLAIVIYIVAVFLSMFINNSATVAILSPMLVSIVDQDPSAKIEPLVWMLVYSAGSCFTTPLGYQTNLMVMPDGKYTFGDFAFFGVPTQFCHMIVTVILIVTLGVAMAP